MDTKHIRAWGYCHILVVHENPIRELNTMSPNPSFKRDADKASRHLIQTLASLHMPTTTFWPHLALNIALIVIGTAAYANTFAGDDVYLQCKGDISIFKTGGLQTVDNQKIAVHIKDGQITFSGNSLLLGENIQICTPSKDEPYFDSETCVGKSRKDRKRKYGTYNKITGALNLTNEIYDSSTALIDGRFECTTTIPVVK